MEGGVHNSLRRSREELDREGSLEWICLYRILNHHLN